MDWGCGGLKQWTVCGRAAWEEWAPCTAHSTPPGPAEPSPAQHGEGSLREKGPAQSMIPSQGLPGMGEGAEEQGMPLLRVTKHQVGQLQLDSCLGVGTELWLGGSKWGQAGALGHE